MKPETRRTVATGVAILFLACFLGLLANGLWKQASGDWRGHLRLAAGGGRVYVQTGGQLFVLGTTGQLMGHNPLPPGIGDSLTDMQVLPDGRIMLARSRPSAVLLCEPLSWNCSPLAPSAMRGIDDIHRAVLDESSGYLIVSDAAGNLWYVPPGDGPAVRIKGGQIKHPEGLAFDRAHRLWVADSGHHGLAVFARQGERWTLERTLPTRNGFSKPSTDRPIDMALGNDGNWWVVQSDRFRHSAELLIYPPGHGVIDGVTLPLGTFPDAVAAIGHAVLVSDTKKFCIYHIDLVSRKAVAFGDTQFRELLKGIGEHRELAQVEEWWGVLATLAVLMISAAVVATPPAKRLKMPRMMAPLEASTAAMPELDGIHWLKKDVQVEQRLRQALRSAWVFPAVIAFMGCLPYLAMWLRADSHPISAQSLAEFRNSIIGLELIAGGVFLQLSYGSRRARAKLGTDGAQLLVMLPSGETLTVAAERLIYDQRSIAFDDHAYVLAPLYEREEVQSYLAPLLSRATKVSSFEMQRYRLAHRDGGLIAGYLFLLLCIAVLFVSGALWAGALNDAGAG